MNTIEKQNKIQSWQQVLNSWSTQKANFEKLDLAPDELTLVWLAGYFKATYNNALDPIITRLKKHTTNPVEIHFQLYIIYNAELLEPPFRQRCELIWEAMEYSKIELMKVKSDHLAYLLCGNSEEGPQTFIAALNSEVNLVKKIMEVRYPPTHDKTGMHKYVWDMINKVIEDNDINEKQFIILVALVLEPQYRLHFLPPVGSNEKILVKPKRFITFMTEFLKPLIERLRYGLAVLGLEEFVKEARPMYMMIDEFYINP